MMLDRARWSHKVTTDAAVEPLSVSEAKSHSRVDITDDDTLVQKQIKSARLATEELLSRALITQTHTLKIDRFPYDGQAIYVPRPPLQSVTSISYVDSDGYSQTWDASNYVVDDSSEPGRIYPAYNVSYPTTRDQRNAVTIVYVAGYGDASTDVPEDLISAISLMVCNFYENRSTTTFGTASVLPKNYDWLIERHRVPFWDIFGA